MPTTPDTAAYKPTAGSKEALYVGVKKGSETDKWLIAPELRIKLDAIKPHLKPGEGKTGLDRITEGFEKRRKPEEITLEDKNKIQTSFGAGDEKVTYSKLPDGIIRVDRPPLMPGETKSETQEVAEKAEDAVDKIDRFLLYSRVTQAIDTGVTVADALRAEKFLDARNNPDVAGFNILREYVLNDLVDITGLEEELGLNEISDNKDRLFIIEDTLARNPRVQQEVLRKMNEIADRAEKYKSENPNVDAANKEIGDRNAKKNSVITRIDQILTSRGIEGLDKKAIEDVLNSTVDNDHQYNIDLALQRLRDEFQTRTPDVNVALTRRQLDANAQQAQLQLDTFLARGDREVTRNPAMMSQLQTLVAQTTEALRQHSTLYTFSIDDLRIQQLLNQHDQLARLTDSTKQNNTYVSVIGSEIQLVANQQRAIDTAQKVIDEDTEARKPQREERMRQERQMLGELEDILGTSVLTVLKQQQTEVEKVMNELYDKVKEELLTAIKDQLKNRYWAKVNNKLFGKEKNGEIAFDSKGNRIRDIDQIGADIRLLASHPKDGAERIVFNMFGFTEDVEETYDRKVPKKVKEMVTVKVPVQVDKIFKVPVQVTEAFTETYSVWEPSPEPKNGLIKVEKSRPATRVVTKFREETRKITVIQRRREEREVEKMVKETAIRTVHRPVPFDRLDTLPPAQQALVATAIQQLREPVLESLLTTYATASVENRLSFGGENPALRLRTHQERLNLQENFGDLLQKKLEEAAPGETEEARRAQVTSIEQSRQIKKRKKEAISDYAGGAAILLSGGLSKELFNALFSDQAA